MLLKDYSEASMQQSHQHLNEITALFQKNKEEAKVVVMPSKSFTWWRVAAMIIVVAGVGLFGWYIMNNNKSTDNAQTIAAVKEKNDPVIKGNRSCYH
jgi:preprotein translocase subunit SecE